MNLAHHLEQTAFFFPDHPAVRQDGVEMTFARLHDSVNQVATGLIKMGIRPGDHIGLCAPNSAEWIIFYFGVLKAGAIAVTLSATLTKDELANLVRHAKLRFIFIAPTRLGELEQLKNPEGIEKIICPGGDLDLRSLWRWVPDHSRPWTGILRIPPPSFIPGGPQGPPRASC